LYSSDTEEATVSDIVNAALLVFVGLFPVVNPLGVAPVFLNMTRQCTSEARYVLARRVAVNGFLLLLSSLLVGSYVLEFFGLTLPVVRIAGGLVVTATGWKLLSSGEDQQDHRAESDQQDHPAESIAQDHVAPPDSFYPLTMPLTVGPGAISVAITLGSRRPVHPESFGHQVLLAGAAVAGLLAIAGTIYICFRFAATIMSRLGEGGTNVLLRLSAFILLCIGIEIMWTGYSALINTIGH
jgi:multiple antibiotic resistance protein